MWYIFEFNSREKDEWEVGETKTVAHPHYIDFLEEFKTLTVSSPPAVQLRGIVKDGNATRLYYLSVPDGDSSFDTFIERFGGQATNTPPENAAPIYPRQTSSYTATR